MRYNLKILLSAVGILFIGLSAGWFLRPEQKTPPLLFLCGAGMQSPVTEIIRNFEKETGIKVQVHFDGSSILREYISSFQAGDLYLPGDENNLDILQEQGLVEERTFLAWHSAALLISPGFAGYITGLDDLAGGGNVRLAMSNPRLTSLGRLVMEKVIAQHPAGGEILQNFTVYGSSSMEMLKLYREGQADVLFEWDAMARTSEGQGLIVVPIEEPYRIKDPLFAGLLKTSKNPVIARQFYNYLITEGREVFQRYGYNIEE
jgi:molybdate transport system substrate-binding protein